MFVTGQGSNEQFVTVRSKWIDLLISLYAFGLSRSCADMFLKCNKCLRKPRHVIPNSSCFVQCVFSLMTSSPLVTVRCEAAALLVELTAVPQVLEAVEKCYLKILSQKDVDQTTKETILKKLQCLREKNNLTSQKYKTDVKDKDQ